MFGPVMHRHGFKLVNPGVVVAAVVLQGFQSVFTPLRIEVDPREQHPGRVNAIFKRNVRGHEEANPKGLCRFEP